MKDKYGNTYEIGDRVVHANTGYGGFRTVQVGVVVKINPKSVRINSYPPEDWMSVSSTNIMQPHTAVIINKAPEYLYG